MGELKYKRILLKLSGEALSTSEEVIEPSILAQYAAEIKEVHDLGVEVAIVIGGGNIFRGAAAAKAGIDRVQGDANHIKHTCNIQLTHKLLYKRLHHMPISMRAYLINILQLCI